MLDEKSEMKISLVMIFVALLSGCSADTSSNTEPDKEPEMFGKKSSQTYVIFSPMQGVLMQDGKPLSHTKIIRRLRWNGNDEEGVVEEFMTDEAGRFSLPIHEEQLSFGMLSQFVGSTKLEVQVDGQNIDVWYNNKFEAPIYAETEKELTDLICELNQEEVVVKSGLSKIMTICRWADMPESVY
jgi:hypothetical protein